MIKIYNFDQEDQSRAEIAKPLTFLINKCLAIERFSKILYKGYNQTT